ncbi:MAG TPA: RNA polymerase sigma factor RpoD/SigA [Gemmatimonadaceae bacterium]|nr:RNA polymerase sigma factor RpoD/SigA [Gemmatimonadaceae bacterium]
MTAAPAHEQIELGDDGLSPSDRDSIEQYFREVGRQSLLTADEERGLGVRVRMGDEAAIAELATRNLRFVISVAKRYQHRGVPLGDLIGEGNVGLLRAARRFDPALGVRFISYAVWWIRQALQSAVARQSSVVRVPIVVARAEGGSRPADISLDTPLGSGGNQTLLDLIGSGEEESAAIEGAATEYASRIEEALSRLPERDAKILRLQFGLDGGREHSLVEIGQLMGVTRERVRQLRDRALRRLRTAPSIGALHELAGAL